MKTARAAFAPETRAGRRLEYFTLGWNLLEAGVAMAAGLMAGSVALIAFGADSLIESFSGGILLWRLQTAADEHREQLATKLVGLSFFALGLYVSADAIWSLVRHDEPEKSIVGIVLATASFVVMPLLAKAKRRLAAQLGSRALHADSRRSVICAYLSAILLIGLLLNALFGWWWADSAAALLMVPIIGKEGLEAMQGEGG
jgi:divalent metal cation (Fe/Co/Zn/Cd) transporter